MKIVHLRDKYLGVTFIYFLLKGFKKHDHYILCREIDKKDQIKFPFDKIFRTSTFFYPLWFIDKFCQVYLKFKYRRINDWISYYFKIKSIKNVNVLHAHMGPQGVYALPIMRKLKIPLVTTFYGADMSEFANIEYWKRKYLTLFEESTAVIVEGPFMKEKMIQLGCKDEKVLISRIGIPVEKINFKYRPRYSKQDDCLRVFMCATFTYKKGFFDAIEVFKLMRERLINFKVYIVGDGILKDRIEDRIKEFDLSKEISLLGRKGLDDIYNIAQDCHLFFHPSKYGPSGDSEGGAPTIILEMQALGLPVISTYHADIPNIIPAVNHKLLAQEGNVSGLFSCFTYLIENNSIWNTISDNGRHFIEENHSNIKCAKYLEDYYAEICKLQN